MTKFIPEKKGNKFRGLEPMDTSINLYDKLMSYRYYRLRSLSESLPNENKTKFKKLFKKLEIIFQGHKFNGDE